MSNKAYNLQAGTTVGVVKFGGLQGLYKVTKCNGNVIEIARESDGYVRTFSNRTGCEKRSYGADSRYNSADIISVDKYEQMVADQAKETKVRSLWVEIEAAASKRDITKLKQLTAQLETI